jgi:mono/diheme cytochrome c family protein
MKIKIITTALLAIVLFSCGTSKTANPPMGEAKKVELTPALAEGKNLYESNCAKCHKLYASSDFSKEEWTPIVARMQKKAHLTDEQGASIYNYLTSGVTN